MMHMSKTEVDNENNVYLRQRNLFFFFNVFIFYFDFFLNVSHMKSQRVCQVSLTHRHCLSI